MKKAAKSSFNTGEGEKEKKSAIIFYMEMEDIASLIQTS